jgi:hypothetical protein
LSSKKTVQSSFDFSSDLLAIPLPEGSTFPLALTFGVFGRIPNRETDLDLLMGVDESIEEEDSEEEEELEDEEEKDEEIRKPKTKTKSKPKVCILTKWMS